MLATRCSQHMGTKKGTHAGLGTLENMKSGRANVDNKKRKCPRLKIYKMLRIRRKHTTIDSTAARLFKKKSGTVN